MSINILRGALISFFSFFMLSGLAQSTKTPIEVPFGVVDEPPIFPGCEEKKSIKGCFIVMLQKHIHKNLTAPLDSKTNEPVTGRVNVVFKIKEDGNIEDINIRGSKEELEIEALRIIELLPRFTPGKQDGRNVIVPYSVNIPFK